MKTFGEAMSDEGTFDEHEFQAGTCEKTCREEEDAFICASGR